MSLIIIQKAQISHYEYQGAEYGTPKTYYNEEKDFTMVSFNITEAIPIWNKETQENDFKQRQWKIQMTNHIAQQFNKEYDMNPNTTTQISITGKLKNFINGKIQDGEYQYKAYADTLNVQSFMIKNIERKKKDDTNSHNEVESNELSGIEDDIPF